MQAPSHRASVAVSPCVRFLVTDTFRTPIPLVRKGHVIALPDNGSIRQAPATTDLYDRFPRLHIEFFARRAPGLDRCECVWTHLKRKLSSGRPDNGDELVEDLLREIQKLARSQQLERGSIHQSGLLPTVR